MLTDEINSYIVILISGSLILLTFLLISNPLKVNKKANVGLGIFFFLWSTYYFEEIIALVNADLTDSLLLLTVHFIQFFTPIIFYFSIQFYTNPDYRVKKFDFVYFILPLLFLAGLIYKQSNNEINTIHYILVVVIIIQALFYSTISYFKIRKHKKKIQLFASDTINIDLKWLEDIIIALIFMSVFISLYNILFTTIYLNVFANLISLVVIFFVAFNSLKQKEIFLLNEDERKLVFESNEETNSEKRKVISDEDLENLKKKLIHLMESEQAYLDADLRLGGLADRLGVTPHQLSYLINEGFNDNFFLYVNRYRVEKVKEMLLNKENDHLSVLGIAFESGFNSKTSFNTTFKKISSQTPSEFKKMSSHL